MGSRVVNSGNMASSLMDSLVGVLEDRQFRDLYEETAKLFYSDYSQTVNFYNTLLAGIVGLATVGFILWAAPRVFQPIWELLDSVNVNITQSAPYGLAYGTPIEDSADYSASDYASSDSSSYGAEYRSAPTTDDFDVNGVLSSLGGVGGEALRRNYDEAPTLTSAMKNSMKLLNKMRLLQ